jgi:hypothetical protein
MSVNSLVLRRRSRIETNFIRLLGVHAQQFCKGEQS